MFNINDSDFVRVDDLSLSTLIALVGRLRATETVDQYLARELEMDQAFFYADTELAAAVRVQSANDTLADLTLIREAVLRAHDLVGESNAEGAVAELNRVIERKIGL